jgi:hypothetical protein
MQNVNATCRWKAGGLLVVCLFGSCLTRRCPGGTVAASHCPVLGEKILYIRYVPHEIMEYPTCAPGAGGMVI